ncbi:hypothetical protein [Demequina aestuarii]|uniref:hypothetical protein n=1 Tax=Demequina aestuarii TaxID=327095 RepID=UPI0007842A55|nr:hypothetical protein [Demequina aestuarii]
MSYGRSIVAVLLVVVGALLSAVWAISATAVRSIEDGTAGDALVASVLDSPQSADVVADQVIDALEDALDTPVGRTALAWGEQQVRDAVTTVVASDAVSEIIRERGSRAKDRLLRDLTDPDREPGAFVLRVNLSERINAMLAEVPVIGALLPEIQLPALSVEVISAEAFEDLRGLFAVMKALSTWGLWCAVVSLAAGIAVSRRWLVFGARALASVGAFAIALSLLLGAMGPSALAGLMPGGRDGGAGVLVEDLLAGVALGPLTHTLMVLGIIAAAGAVIWWGAVRGFRVGRDDGGGDGSPSAGQPRDEPGAGPVDLRTTSS